MGGPPILEVNYPGWGRGQNASSYGPSGALEAWRPQAGGRHDGGGKLFCLLLYFLPHLSTLLPGLCVSGPYKGLLVPS